MRRDEIIDISRKLFGERGYRATSVADIQRAAGMTGGSGALYKHFGSKDELLAEVVRAYTGELESASSSLAEVLPTEPEPALQMIATVVLDAMARDRDVLRIAFRDLDEFAEIRERLWQNLLAALYNDMTVWLQGLHEAGRAHVENPDATAAVLVASITYFRILESMLAHTPGDVSPDDYRAAWVASALATIGADRRG